MDDPKKYWLDEPRNVLKVYWTVIALCVALFVADAFYHKHTHFEVENWFGFYGIYGFVACVGLVLVAKLLRIILIRPEDYYDD
jgi:hypothetical protein